MTLECNFEQRCSNSRGISNVRDMAWSKCQGQLRGEMVHCRTGVRDVFNMSGNTSYQQLCLVDLQGYKYNCIPVRNVQPNSQLQVPFPGLLRSPSLCGSTEAVDDMLMTRAGSRFVESLQRSSVSLPVQSGCLLREPSKTR